jgi:hypothetical protein
LVAGKFKNPLWEPGDMIWDTDINPEGAGAQFNYGLDSKTSLFMNTGVFVLDESSSSGKNDDPMMYVLQPGVTYQLTDDISIKGAFSYYNCANVKGTALDGDTNTNSQTAGSVLENSYRWITPAVEVSVNNPLGFLGEDFPVKLPYLGLFTEYVSNTALDDNESGQMIGLKFGDAKVDGWRKWQFKYSYARLENDAVLDILPDSDRYGGKTGVRGHEGILEFGLGKNVTLALDYYYAQALAKKSSQQPAHVFQADFNFKF